MKLRVLFFSVLRDISGVSEAALECLPGATMADLLEIAYQQWPRLREWDSSLLLAVDHDYVRRDHLLHEGAEVALMPPVQGG